MVKNRVATERMEKERMEKERMEKERMEKGLLLRCRSLGARNCRLSYAKSEHESGIERCKCYVRGDRRDDLLRP